MHINDLPVELLGEIFDAATCKAYLTANKFVPLVFAFRRGYCPFTLTHVCRLWRDVAISIPSLWSYLNAVQDEPLQPCISAMAQWLEHSRNAALHFRLSSWEDTRGSPFDAQHSRKMLQLFAEHVHRWRSLSIDVGNNLLDDLTAVLQETANPPPLEGLEIEFRHDVIEPLKTDKIASLLCNAKSLKRLYWLNHQGRTIPHLPWRQLETISIETLFEPTEALECLSQCTAARSVTIHGWRDPSHPLTFSNPPHITLDTLTTLILSKTSDPLPLLSCFTLPSLKHLELGIYQRDFQALEIFLKRSRCPLKTLIVIDTTAQSDDIVDFFTSEYLRSIPNVQLGPADFESEILGLQKLLEASKSRVGLPPLMIWKEWYFSWPLLIGWRETGRLGARYVLENGKVTRTK